MGPRLRADQRREAILDAATPLFAERGFNAVTTREIAQAADVSEALLYRHFSSKRDIFTAIEGACVSEAQASAKRFAELPDDTASLVLLVFALMAQIQLGPPDRVEEHRRWQRLVVQSMLSDGTLAARFLKQTAEPWTAKLRACLEAAQDCGDLDTLLEDGELGIWLGHHLSIAIVLYGFSGAEIVTYPGDRDRLLERSVEFCLRGMGLSPAAIRKHYNPVKLAALLSATS